MTPVIPEPRPDAAFVEIAKDQPEYLPLPANYKYPYVETKWELSWRERLNILWNGTFYLKLMTFGRPLQPIRLSCLREEEL